MKPSQTLTCPTCGQNVSSDARDRFAESAIDLQIMFRERGANLTRMQSRFLAAIRGKNRPVQYGMIFDQLYGWRPDGDMPTDDTLKVMATKCRQAIEKAGLGWRINCHWGLGYELDETGQKKAIRRVACVLMILLPLGQVLLSRLA